MVTILLSVLRPLLPYLAAGVILLGGGTYIVFLRHDLQNAQQKNAALAAVNAENLAAITTYKAEQVKWSTALQALDARTLATSTAAQKIATTISLAPQGDDAPVAPVLAQALDSLRALQGGAP